MTDERHYFVLRSEKIAVCLPVNRIQNSSFVVGVEEGDGDDDKARHFLGGRLRESY